MKKTILITLLSVLSLILILPGVGGQASVRCAETTCVVSNGDQTTIINTLTQEVIYTTVVTEPYDRSLPAALYREIKSIPPSKQFPQSVATTSTKSEGNFLIAFSMTVSFFIIILLCFAMGHLYYCSLVHRVRSCNDFKIFYRDDDSFEKDKKSARKVKRHRKPTPLISEESYYEPAGLIGEYEWNPPYDNR